jgi:hypothetical protein
MSIHTSQEQISKDVASFSEAFARAVSTKCLDEVHLLAKHGDESLYSVFVHLYPQVIKSWLIA